MTESVFKTWKTSRKLIDSFFDSYTTVQLNKIPAGFSNNLVWNMGHIIVAQQSLIYRLSGIPMHISTEMFELYKPGSKPTGNTSDAEIQELRSLLSSLIEKTASDFRDGIFVSFTERMTGTGFHLSSLADAFEFNNYHEGMHLGMMMSIRKFV
jgi:hypothetical protein